MRMFLFDRQQKVKRWLTDQDFIEAKMTEEINTASKLVFSLPLNKRLSTSYFYAAIPQPQGSGYVLFKIITEQVKSDRINYIGVESAYDELKTYHYIKDVRPQNRSAADMLRQALEGTRWISGVVSDAGANSTNFYYISSLEAIQKIANLFQLEATFAIILDPKTNEITRRQVNLYSQQGQRTGKRFEYGSNLLKVEQEESAENLITALIGRGKGEQVSTGDENTPDGYGRRINFGDVVWSKKNGNPVDKPAGQEYVEDPDATAAYGFNDGKPRMGLQIFEDITDPTELLQATWSALQTLKRPRVSFKADVLDVGSLGLGDTVAIIRHDIKIEYFTRVYKVEHNLLNERLNTIELGDDFNSQSITNTINSIADSIQQAEQAANHAVVAANGKNTNSYGQTQPTTGVEGDLWYKDLGNGETDMYQYHDGAWVLIQSTRDLHNVADQVKETQQSLKDLRDNPNVTVKVYTSAQDLNKLTIAGSYLIKATNNTNAPITNWLTVRVEGTGDKLRQTIAADNNPDLSYVRTYNVDTWSAWKQQVTSGNIIAQINVGAESTLIKNNKIYMDASSTYFSGKAFIPDAAISNLSADKITTGTLNAGLINVINLNASSITTGTINGANLKIDLNNGEVQFKRGRITSIANTLNINIDTGTMSVTDSVNNGVYFANGELKLMDDPLNITGTPKYGGLRRSVHIWSPGSAGAELHSPNGVFVGSDNYNGAFAGGSMIDGTTSGAALAVDKNGSATLNGGNIVSVSGGGAYDVGYSMKNRPAIILGKSPSGWNPGDRTFIQGSYVHIKPVYDRTSGGSPNVIVNQDGALVRSTSASKYKTDINRSYQTDYGKKLLSLPTATWVDKGQKERYQAGKRSIEPEKYFGMIAEDLADAGLDLLVTRNTVGEIEGIQYDRIAVALIPVIKELKNKIEKLEAK